MWALTEIKDSLSAVAGSVGQLGTLTKDSLVGLGGSVLSFVKSPNVRGTISFYFLQAYTGLEQTAKLILPPNLLKLNQKPLAFKLTLQSAFNNLVVYAGPVIVYEGYVKPLLEPFLPEDDTYSRRAIEGIISLMWVRTATHMLIYNTAYCITANSLVGDESCATPMPPCGCEGKLTQATLSSGMYYGGNMLTVSLLSSTELPYLGPACELFLKPLVYGQCLVEYELAESCTTHRVEYFSKHNAYCMGLGFGVQSVTYMGCKAIEWTTGAQSAFIEDALFSFIFPQLIMQMRYHGIAPSAKTEASLNFFGLSRAATDKVIDTTKNFIEPKIRQADLNGRLLEYLKETWDTSPVKLARTVALPRNMQSAEGIVTTPAIKLLLKVNYDAIYSQLDSARNASKFPRLLNGVSYFNDIIPNFVLDNTQKAAIDVIKREGMKDKLGYLQYLLKLSQTEHDNNTKNAKWIRRPSFEPIERRTLRPELADIPPENETKPDPHNRKSTSALITTHEITDLQDDHFDEAHMSPVKLSFSRPSQEENEDFLQSALNNWDSLETELAEIKAEDDEQWNAARATAIKEAMQEDDGLGVGLRQRVAAKRPSPPAPALSHALTHQDYFSTADTSTAQPADNTPLQQQGKKKSQV